MSWEAWGTPSERQEPPQRCPVCDGEWHAEDCELGQEVARRLKAEGEAHVLRALLADALAWIEEACADEPVPESLPHLQALRDRMRAALVREKGALL